MAEVLLFHHAMGQTEGFHSFADELREAGHTVHTPDLFEGRTFGSIEVSALCAVEHHPGLVHLVSTVHGDLRPGSGWWTTEARFCPPRAQC